MKIWIIGLGNGRVDDLPLGVYRLLQSEHPLFIRTADHPLVSWLQQEGIKYQTFDAIYEQHDTFAPVYEEIVQQLLALVRQHNEIFYAVPGHPSVAEQTVQQLLTIAPQQGVEVEIKGGQSFLDPLFTRLGVDPIEGFVMLNGESFTREQLQPSLHTVIGQIYDQFVASDVKLTLMEVYPDETPVTLVQSVGIEEKEQVMKIPLYELDQQKEYGNFTSLYIPPYSEQWKLTRSFSTLISVFAHLRSPEGCPWDREQTHQTLKRYLLEETYEVLEAIDEEDSFHLAEELGDLLLQVLFHAQIASEQGEFDIYDVIEGLNSKLIRRHPHVFGQEETKTAEAVEGTWDRIKQQEKGNQPTSLLAGIPKGMSALAYAWELQKRASKVGFDWAESNEVYKKIEEESEELRSAQGKTEREKELGDLLFTVVNLSRFYDLHPELALTQTNQKFHRRFAYIEEQAQKLGKSWVDCSLEEMDQWWEEAKKVT
jgi:tetrapyrrole methylase family protein/MazG family protein